MADSSRRRRILIVLPIAAAGITFYGVYELYHHSSVARNLRSLSSLLRSLASVSDAASSTADTVSILSSDLYRFLSSDADRIPTSLKQMAKLVQSDDFAASISRASGAVASGILRGVNGAVTTTSSNGAGLYDQVVDKVLSDDGMGVVSVLAGSFGRGLVEGLYSGGISDSQGVPWWVELICEDKLRPVIRDCIQMFVGTAVTVYLEKMMDINIYDEIFAGLTNPKHETKMKDMLVSVCNGSMETLVRTSHQVLTDSGSALGRRHAVGRNAELEQYKDTSSSHQCSDNAGSSGRVSSALLVTDNRKLVLDLLGRMSFEMVRSFLEYPVQKLYVNGRRAVNVVRETIVEKGMEVLMYVGAKSMIILAISIAVCLYVLFGTRVLLPASDI